MSEFPKNVSISLGEWEFFNSICNKTHVRTHVASHMTQVILKSLLEPNRSKIIEVTQKSLNFQKYTNIYPLIQNICTQYTLQRQSNGDLSFMHCRQQNRLPFNFSLLKKNGGGAEKAHCCTALMTDKKKNMRDER